MSEKCGRINFANVLHVGILNIKTVPKIPSKQGNISNTMTGSAALLLDKLPHCSLLWWLLLQVIFVLLTPHTVAYITTVAIVIYYLGC